MIFEHVAICQRSFGFSSIIKGLLPQTMDQLLGLKYFPGQIQYCMIKVAILAQDDNVNDKTMIFDSYKIVNTTWIID